MGFENLSKRLREKAEIEITQINQRHNAESKAILDEISAEAERISSDILSKANAQAHMLEMKETSKAKRNAKKEIENRKSQMMDEILEQAKKNILKLPDDRKALMLERLCKDSEIFGKDSVIFIDEKYSDLIAKAKPSKIGDFGVMIRSKDGCATIDNRLNTIVETNKTRLCSKAAKKIFGAEDA